MMKFVVMMLVTNLSVSVLNFIVRSIVLYIDVEFNILRNILGLLKGRREFVKLIFKELYVIDCCVLYFFFVESSFNLVKFVLDDGKVDFW